MNKLPKNPAQLIRAARQKTNLSQVRFGSEVLDVSQNVLSRYETGRINNPPAWAIIRCANILLENDRTSDERGSIVCIIDRLIDTKKGKKLFTVTELIEALDLYSQSKDSRYGLSNHAE